MFFTDSSDANHIYNKNKKNLLFPIDIYEKKYNSVDKLRILFENKDSEMRFILLKSGILQISINRIFCTILPGECICILPLRKYILYAGVCSYTEISFSTDILSTDVTDDINVKYINPLVCDNSIDCISYKNDTELQKDIISSLLKISDMYSKKYIGYELMIKSLLCRIISETVCTHEFRADNNIPDILQSILKFIKNNCCKSLSRRVIADYAGISEDYLCELFRKNLKISPMLYRSKCRIRECAALLASTDKPISDISNECGFKSLRTFNDQFMKFQGITPMEYRKLYYKN